MTWILTLAHRRAVDRVRSAQAATDRERRAALLEQTPAYDEVTEQVEARLEREQVRRCLRTLTELQRQSVTLAYYQNPDEDTSELKFGPVPGLTLSWGHVKTNMIAVLRKSRQPLSSIVGSITIVF